jgi:hypothetical protein
MQGKWTVRVLFCLSLLMMFVTNTLAARGMWGSKRKREEEEEEEAMSAGMGGGRFENRNQMASKPQKTNNDLSGFENALSGSAGMGETVENMINMYLNMMEELVESPDFEGLITPESIKGMFDQVGSVNELVTVVVKVTVTVTAEWTKVTGSDSYSIIVVTVIAKLSSLRCPG